MADEPPSRKEKELGGVPSEAAQWGWRAEEGPAALLVAGRRRPHRWRRDSPGVLSEQSRYGNLLRLPAAGFQDRAEA